MSDHLLQVQDLCVEFRQGRKKIMAVDGASFSIQAGETVGIVGESGSGKSTIANAILGLVPITSGQITFAGEPTITCSSPKFLFTVEFTPTKLFFPITTPGKITL